MKETNIQPFSDLDSLKKEVLRISYENKLSHIGSCITSLPILMAIYSLKEISDKVVVSSGHAHLAHALVMAQESGKDPMEYMKAGIHCDRDNGCDVSTGSLGQGLPIAVGMALSDRSKNVYCLASDGEMAEGSMWEAINVMVSQRLINLRVAINVNGYSGYGMTDIIRLKEKIKGFGAIPFVVPCTTDRIKSSLNFLTCETPVITLVMTDVNQYPFLKGLDAHYAVISEETWKELNQK